MIFSQRDCFASRLRDRNGESWRDLRDSVRQLMLEPRSVQEYLPEVQSIADDLMESIYRKRDSKNQVITLHNELGKFNQEAAAFVCFDRRLGYFSEEKSKLVHNIIKANRTVFYLSGLLRFSLPFYKYWNTPKWNKIVAAENFLMRNTTKNVNETIQSLTALIQSGVVNDRFPFIKSLLAKKNLTKKDVTILIHSMCTDGLSTVVPALMCSLYCLATNENAQETAFEEICAVTKGSKTLTASMINRLSYLKAVIKESDRLLPSTVEIVRILKKDLLLSGFLVPAKTTINMNMTVHLKSEEYFKDPLEFRPERWLRGNKDTSVHPFVTIPFSHGVRSCPGRRFAEQEMAIVLCKTLQNFKLKYLASEKPLELLYNSLLFPNGPLKVQFIPR